MYKRVLFIGMFLVISIVWLVFSQFNNNGALDETSPLGKSILPTVSALVESRKAKLVSRLPPAIQFNTGLENLSDSFHNIEVDGSLDVDQTGRLIINANVRRVFDFFFNAVGEEPYDRVVARIHAYINSKLPQSAATEANNVLRDYLALKQALDESLYNADDTYAADKLSIDELKQRKAELKTIRKRILTPEEDEAFFSEEDQFDDYTLAKLEILQNDKLSPAVRAKKVAELEYSLPVSVQDSIRATMRQQDLAQLTHEWQNRNGSQTELRQIRENLVGPEAADRLEKLDQESADWNMRVAEWLDERTQILRNESLSETEKASQVDFLRSNLFTFEEITRVQALERMQDYASIK